MNRPQHHRPDLHPDAFLVERYLSPAAAVDLAASTARLALVCDSRRVRYLLSAYLPTEDTCFCLFQAASAGAVQAVNEQAHFAYDRIVNAVLMLDAGPPRPSSQS